MPIRFNSRRQVRNWRDFIREILIIVVGVLIALGASHVAEQWTWQRRVDDAEAQLVVENRNNFAYLAEAVAVGPCIQRQLSLLRERVLVSGDTLDPATVHEDGFAEFVFRAPSRPVATTMWKSLNADGTVPHLEEWRRFGYARMDSQVGIMSTMAIEMGDSVGRLRVLGFPLALDAATRSGLLEAIEEERYRSRLYALMALQVLATIRDLGNAPDDDAPVRELLDGSGTVQFCKAQGLPLADWRAVLDEVPREVPEA